MTDDLTLLHEYSRHNSQEAFAVLASRYVNLVYSVALRQTHDATLAEEVTQAVFIILARKASSLDRKVILPGWLCRTARYASANALTIQRRRQRREQEAHMQSTMNEPESETWQQIAPLLETAMEQLKRAEHDAVVLRFFEGKTFRDVGAALGSSEDAAKMRVTRALEKLRKFLAKHGVVSTTTIIAGVISANSVQAAPVTLANSVTTVAAAKGALAAGSILALVKGTMSLMTWIKAKTVIVASVVTLAAAGTATLAFPQMREAVSRLGKTPGGAQTMAAVKFLGDLQLKGQLPGFPKNEKRSGIIIPGLTYSNSAWQMSSTNVEVYPVIRELTVITNAAGGFVWHYKVSRESERNGWLLQKAWRTDHGGKVLEEYPVR